MLSLDTSRPGHPLRMPWRNAISVGRAYELLRDDLLAHLAAAQRDIGYRYCRFHAIFHDDMGVVVKRGDGTLAYQWHHVDKVYDRLLSIGLKPFIELNPMPALLASGSQTMFHYRMNVTPPADWGQWRSLVAAFTGHLVDRYGLDEVRSWYFEVWNEPNLPGFWSGTQADYWRLYDESAAAIKGVDARLRVGGPATSKANWIAEMIDHCVDRGVPLDFVSTHLYPQDEHVAFPDPAANPHRPGAFFSDTVRQVQEVVRASRRPDLEIHWTEWNAMSCRDASAVDWCNNASNDQLYGASFIVRQMIALDGAADTLCWWVASDIFEEGGIPSSAFSMTYGLQTIHGIPKANYRAFEALRRMRGGVLPVSGAIPDLAACVATREHDVVRVLLANQPVYGRPGQPWSDAIRLTRDGGCRILTARIAANAGSAYESWIAMGSPHTLAPSEEALLRAHSQPAWTARVHPVDDPMVTVPFTLAPGDVLYIEIRPLGESALPRTTDPAALAAWDLAMGARSR